MRGITVLAGLALALLVTSGCKQYVFLHECDDKNYANIMPQWLQTKPQSIQPGAPVFQNSPATVEDPERPIRYLSLAEAIAIALENGNTGEGSPNSLLGFGGLLGNGTQVGSDNIRVFALIPARAATAIDYSLSKFDAIWNTSISWNNIDRPVGTPLDTFQAANQTNAIEQQEASLNTSLIKPLPTGGVTGITFNTDYQLTNLPARVNPSYRPALQFQFEQPLLQGYGVEINQIRQDHPNRFLSGQGFRQQYTPPVNNEGILISRIRFDQTRAEFERRINVMLLNVETAYWTLYGSYWTLFAQEQALRIAFEAWKLVNAQFQAGRVSEIELAAARSQYEQFRSQRLAALASGGGGGGIQPFAVSQSPGVLEAERQLRNLLNLPIEDGTRLVPSDTPTLAPYRPDWNVALNEALNLRPELIMAREEVKVRQLQLILAKNYMLPDLRLGANYDINAIGNRLDGPSANGAFHNLASNHFNNWNIALNMNIPVGYRQAYSYLRGVKLELAQGWNTLQAEELKIQRALAQPYRLLFELYEQLKILRAQREATANELRANYELVVSGRATPQVLLGPMQKWSNALSAEYNFIVQYNVQLAAFEFGKGTILQHNNVHIAEGPLPQCAQVRAVEHERQRTKALVIAERKNPNLTSFWPRDGGAPVPPIPTNAALPLPRVIETAPPLPPEKLGMPRELGPSSQKPNDKGVIRTTIGTVTLDPMDDLLDTPPTSQYPVPPSSRWRIPEEAPKLPRGLKNPATLPEKQR